MILVPIESAYYPHIMRFQLVPKSSTLDDLELELVEYNNFRRLFSVTTRKL